MKSNIDKIFEEHKKRIDKIFEEHKKRVDAIFKEASDGFDKITLIVLSVSLLGILIINYLS